MLLNGTMYEVTKTIVVDVEDYAIDALDGVANALQENLAEDYGHNITEDVYGVVLMDVYRAIVKRAVEKIGDTEEWLNNRVIDANVKKITEEEED